LQTPLQYQHLTTIKERERMSAHDIGEELYRSLDGGSAGSSPSLPTINGGVSHMSSDVGPEGLREEGASVSPQVGSKLFKIALIGCHNRVLIVASVVAATTAALHLSRCFLTHLMSLAVLLILLGLLILLKLHVLCALTHADTLANYGR